MTTRDLYGIRGSGLGGAPVPPGTEIPNLQAMEILATAAEQLQLVGAGVYTPWAAQDGAYRWDVVETPDTNIATFQLTDQGITLIKGLTFGQPLPFVALIGDTILTPQQKEAIFDGTEYQFHETMAVYNQADTNPVPRIRFLHWGELRSAYQPRHESLQAAAQNNGMTLVFAQQVPIQTTSIRQQPAIPFSQALENQFTPTTPTPVEPGGRAIPPAVPSGPPAQASIGVPLMIGAAAGVAGFFGLRAVTKGKAK